jgi:peptidoglycan hydrolase-like protein with peptidoglycan-binding domain
MSIIKQESILLHCHKNPDYKFSKKRRRSMRKGASYILLAVLVMALAGCASSKTSENANERIGLLTNEVARLDTELRETRAALQAQQEKNSELKGQASREEKGERTESGPSGVGLYRTPSGFELASKDIQTALKNAGHYTGEIDGKIGPGTRDAIRAFQEANGMTADGICGKGTWEKLKTYLTTK